MHRGQPGGEGGDPDPIDCVGRQASPVLAADHPRVVPAGVLPRGARGAPVRSARLQQDLRDGVLDAADALAAAADRRLDLQARDDRAQEFPGERRRQGLPVGAATGDSIPLRVHGGRHARADSGGGAPDGFPKDFLPDIDEGRDPLHADDAAGAAQQGSRLDRPADGQEAEGVSGSRARLRQDRPGRHVHRSGAAHDDRNDGAAQAEVDVAQGHDEGEARRRNGQGGGDHRVRERVGPADPRARHDAEHGHSDAGRHQGQRPGRRGHRGPLAADRGPAARISRARSRSSPSAFRRAITSTCRTISRRMAEHGVTVDEAMSTVRYAIGGDNIVGVKQAEQHRHPVERAVFARVHRHARQDQEDAGRDRRTGARFRWATSRMSRSGRCPR